MRMPHERSSASDRPTVARIESARAARARTELTRAIVTATGDLTIVTAIEIAGTGAEMIETVEEITRIADEESGHP
jgi:hypothetical protein